jgi:hypothetical protein
MESNNSEPDHEIVRKISSEWLHCLFSVAGMQKETRKLSNRVILFPILVINPCYIALSHV